MTKFITSIPASVATQKAFMADTIDRIVLLRNFCRIAGVYLSLVDSKSLVEANAQNIFTAHDFIAFVEAVISDRKASA